MPRTKNPARGESERGEGREIMSSVPQATGQAEFLAQARELEHLYDGLIEEGAALGMPPSTTLPAHRKAVTDAQLAAYVRCCRPEVLVAFEAAMTEVS